MPTSLESSRPIMAPSLATTNRMSTYSMQAPSLAGTIQTTDSTVADIRTIATGLERMDNPALSSQRVSLTDKKEDDLKKLALGAKLDRALERRMVGQDAVMRPRGKSLAEKEKIDGEEAEANAEAEAETTAGADPNADTSTKLDAKSDAKTEAESTQTAAERNEVDGKAESAKANTQGTDETMTEGHVGETKNVDESSAAETEGDDGYGGDGDYVAAAKA